MAKLGQALEILDMTLDASQLLQILPRLYKRYIKKEKPAADIDEQKLVEMIKNGQSKEAMEEALSAWSTGFSKADEFRLLGELCYLALEEPKKRRTITEEQAVNFMAFMTNLTDEERSNFRDGYISEKRVEKRLITLAFLARLKTDDERKKVLSGSGLFDPDAFQKIKESLEAPFEKLSEMAGARAVRLKNERVNPALKPVVEPKNKPSLWQVFKTGLGFRIFDKK